MKLTIDLNVNFNFIPSAIAEINRKLDTIMATQAEHLVALEAMRTALAEAGAEIVAKLEELTGAIAKAGNTSAEIDALTADLTTRARALADIVPGP